jgi:hypothetical protein
MEFLGLFARWFLFGGAVLYFTWRFAYGIRRRWLRGLLVASVAAFAFTPTLAHLERAAGLWPLPAGWVAFCGIALAKPEDRVTDILLGGIPIIAMTLILWLLSFLVFKSQPGCDRRQVGK